MSVEKKSTLLPAMAVGLLPMMQSRATIPWWVWVLLIIVLIILLYLLLRGGSKEENSSAYTVESQSEPAEPQPEALLPDDLTIIEGVGPKISQFLNDAGILTYQQLADADMEKINQMLDEANLRLADPSTWGEQAKLAAAGDWENLQKLQDELKGGRRQ